MKIKLHYKITYTILFIVLSILAGVYFYARVTLTHNAYTKIQKNILNQTRLAKVFAERSELNLKDVSSIDSLANEIGSTLGLRATIINAEGKVVGDSEIEYDNLQLVENHLDRPEVQAALKNGVGKSRRFSTTIRKELVYTAAKFETSNDYGFVRLSLPLSEVDEILNRIKYILIVTILAAVAVSFIISFFASNFISKPIRDIAFMAQSLARSNYTRKVRVRTNDELEDLAESFNYMAKQIRMRINEATSGRSRLEAVFLSMIEGVMVVDEKGQVLLVNKALCEFFCIKDGFTGKKPLEVVRSVELQGLVDRALERTENVERYELNLPVPEEKILHIHATPVTRENKTEGAVLVFHDITELRRLERMRRDFVSNVSHELRTPLTSIKGYSETLLDGALEDTENARDFIQIINNESERLSHMVNDILDLSRIESEDVAYEIKAVNLLEVSARVIHGLKQKAECKEIYVSNNIKQNIPKVKADENLIAQVFVNLIDNAIKYTLLGGKVIIDAVEDENDVMVSISDTGIGIPDEDIARVFERFYRVDKARSRKFGGTGLGLAIVKHIIQRHEGIVSVSSRINEGTVFTFTLPKA